jgi:RNA polymerase sigma factor (TIGR02999 family)
MDPLPKRDVAATQDIHRLLDGVREGRREDWDRLFTLVYEDLRRLARHHLRGRPTGTLGTTAIVNEAYLRLAGQTERSLQDRVHFMAVASRAMRYVLADHARAKLADKRGGGAARVELDSDLAVEHPRVQEILELEEALTRLGELNERLVRVVELRFFGGLTVPEAAEVLGVKERTVERDWFKARAFLHHHLRDEP